MAFDPAFSVFLSILTAICWGANAHLIRMGMRGENHFHGLFVRAIFAFPILFGVVMVWKGIDGLLVYTHNPVFAYAFASAMLVLTGDSLFLIGLSKYSVNVMAPITAAYPIFTSIVLIIIGEETIGIFLFLGTLLVITGVAAVTSNDITKTFDKMALILGTITAMCWGISIVFVRLALKEGGTDSMGLTGVRMMIIGISAIFIYRIGITTGKITDTKHTRDKSSTKFMAASGLIGWVFGASLFFAAVQRIGAAIPTPISSTSPIVASIIGQILGVEHINIKQFSGIMISVIGVIIIVMS